MEGGTNYTSTAISQGWPGSSLSDLSPYTGHLQVKAESGPIHGIGEGSGGPYDKNLLPQPTFPGHKGVPPVPIEGPASRRINHTDLDATYNSCKDDIMLNCTASSAVTEVSRKKHAAVPSRATVQPVNVHDIPKSLFPCDKCDKQYTQPQGVTRHQREVHEINLCPICNNFRWGRRYQLTKHLEKRHPDIVVDASLYGATRCRRGATMNKKLQQRQVSPALECDQRSHGEPLPRSLVHTLPAVAKDSSVSLPATLSMAYDPRADDAEKPVTSCKREDARGLDSFDPTTNALSASSSTEECPQPLNDGGMSVQHGQTWSSLARTGGSTPADHPSSFVTVPILYYPVPTMYDSLLFETNTFYRQGQILRRRGFP